MKIQKYSEHFEVFEELKEGTKRPKAYMEVNKSDDSVILCWIGDDEETLLELDLYKYEMEELKAILDFALDKLKKEG